MKILTTVNALALLGLSIAALGQTAPGGVLSAAGTPATASGPARPAPAPPARGPALDLAVEAAQLAISTCATNGFKVGATVVDSGGGVRVVLIADGAGSRLGDFATRKAITSLTFKIPTSKVEQQAKIDQAMATQIAAEPTRFMVRAGGLPLLVNGEVIGAIGVGGAPDSAQDEVCALAAVAKIQGQLK